MEEKRRHIRTSINLKVRITHPGLGTVYFLTRDISNSGMFLVIEDAPSLPVGEIVDVQVLDVVDQPPVCRMKVGRLQNDGVGLMLYDNNN